MVGTSEDDTTWEPFDEFAARFSLLPARGRAAFREGE